MLKLIHFIIIIDYSKQFHNVCVITYLQLHVLLFKLKCQILASTTLASGGCFN